MVLEDRDVDELEVRAVGRAVPDPFPEFDPPAAGRRETGIGDVLVAPVPLGLVLAGADERAPDGVEEERGNAGVAEETIDEPSA